MHEVQPIHGVVNTSRLLLRRLTHQQGQGTGSFQMQPPQPQVVQQQTSLKCPRCDSLNTKFCYYNNYNLSQPRHFCKNCRRYWTKGGVLRNVPVGGGCRKSKRSSSKHNKSSSSTSKATTVNYSGCNNNNGSNSHSSSDSSSAAAAALGGASLFKIPEIDDFVLSSDLFSGEIEGFMNLITQDKNNNDDDISVALDERNNVSTPSFSEFLQCQGVQDCDMGKIFGGGHGEEKIAGAIGLLHQTDRIEDLLHNKGSIVGLPTLDWHLSAAPGTNNHGSLFHISDNSSTVDHHHHQGYLVQSAVDHHHHDFQWSDSTTSHLPLSFLD